MRETYFAGVEIGGSKLQIILGTADGKILQRARFQVDRQAGGEGIRQLIREHLSELLKKEHKPLAIGIGFGGPVDYQTGKTCCSHQITGWDNFDFRAWFRTFTSLPVVIDNDANVAALGEAVYGAGKNNNPVFYVTLGSGVGGGLVLDKKIYHGAKPGESEIGHLRVDKSGAIVESRCAGWAVDRKIRDYVKTNPDSRLAALTQGMTEGEAKVLGVALSEKDSAAETILAEVAFDLAFALSHVTHLFHPETIVLGGGLSLIGEPLTRAVENHLVKFVMEAFEGGPRIELAALGEDVVPIGCLALASSAA